MCCYGYYEIDFQNGKIFSLEQLRYRENKFPKWELVSQYTRGVRRNNRKLNSRDDLC